MNSKILSINQKKNIDGERAKKENGTSEGHNRKDEGGQNV